MTASSASIPTSASKSPADAARVKALSRVFAPEAVQLAYQICVQGRADLALAPDEAMGFSMTLLRLLAFEPASESNGDTAAAPHAAPKTRAAGRSIASAPAPPLPPTAVSRHA